MAKATTTKPAAEHALKSVDTPITTSDDTQVDTQADADEDSANIAVVVRKKEIMARILERADTRQKIAKPIVEATLEILGEALAAGETLALQPLGQIKVKRIDDGEKASVVHCRVRQSKDVADPETDVDSEPEAVS